MSHLHQFYETTPKLLARVENVRLYRTLSGLRSIPSDRYYWTLASEQRDTDESEINQILALGLIHSKTQFVGVDRDDSIQEKNRIVHPDATWITDEWEDAISLGFHVTPACVYLDTESLAGKVTLNMTARTMMLAPEGTVLLLNVMQSSPYRAPMESTEFLQSLSSRVPNLDEWIPAGGVPRYEYTSQATLMRTYGFYRRAA